jgi:hypothetical protein
MSEPVFFSHFPKIEAHAIAHLFDHRFVDLPLQFMKAHHDFGFFPVQAVDKRTEILGPEEKALAGLSFPLDFQAGLQQFHGRKAVRLLDPSSNQWNIQLIRNALQQRRLPAAIISHKNSDLLIQLHISRKPHRRNIKREWLLPVRIDRKGFYKGHDIIFSSNEVNQKLSIPSFSLLPSCPAPSIPVPPPAAPRQTNPSRAPAPTPAVPAHSKLS